MYTWWMGVLISALSSHLCQLPYQLRNFVDYFSSSEEFRWSKGLVVWNAILVSIAWSCLGEGSLSRLTAFGLPLCHRIDSAFCSCLAMKTRVGTAECLNTHWDGGGAEGPIDLQELIKWDQREGVHTCSRHGIEKGFRSRGLTGKSFSNCTRWVCPVETERE